MKSRNLITVFLNGILFGALLLIFSCQAVAAVEVAGVKVPEKISIGESGSQLVLNGAGIRKKLFIKVYVGALYLSSKQNTVAAILNAEGPKQITMHFLYKEVTAKKLVKGWNEGFEGNSTASEVKLLQERINRFNKLFRTVKKGDVIRLDYSSDQGTQVWINDKLMGTVEGNDFNRALLKIWLGPKPADGGLKKAWLGK